MLFHLVLVSIPPRHFGLIEECSSLVLKGICVCGGVIDPDYQGEIQTVLQNEGKDNLFINKHDRTAQLLILPCVTGKVQKGELSTFTYNRGDGGEGLGPQMKYMQLEVNSG